MKRSLTKAELREMLTAAGHTIEDRDDCPAPVWPPWTKVVGVGIGAKGFTHLPQHYFVCRPLDLDDADAPYVSRDPAFALAPLFAAAEQSSPEDRFFQWFLLGPMRWLVQRIHDWPSAWLWCDRYTKYYFEHFREGRQGDCFPRLCEWLARHLPTETQIAAIHLDLADPLDVSVLWEKAKHVNRDIENYYLCDPAAREVYYLHHHDQILTSVPDKMLWVQMVGELLARPDLFEDHAEECVYIPDEEDEEAQDD